MDDGKSPPKLPRPIPFRISRAGLSPSLPGRWRRTHHRDRDDGCGGPASFQQSARRAFPPERNHLAAHITLFHQLPPSCDRRTRPADPPYRRRHAPPTASLREIYSLGGGVAYRIDSPDLLEIRDRIADHFTGMLTMQDQGTPRLHITVQNKVAPAEARALLADLAADFRPRPLTIAGLAAHHYLGGPWEQAFARNFRGARE
jgi:hypothetical protein